MTSGTEAELPPIVFFGTEEYSLIVLETIHKAGFPIAAVVTKPTTKRGRKQQLAEPSVKRYARAHDIAVWQPVYLNGIVDDIKKLNEPIGVLAAYGKIVPESILELFTPGIVNIHPSLLPLYRGPSPVEAAIANRDRKTGVTLMQLAKAMDAGPIYMQVPYALDFTETKPELYTTLFTLGSNLIVRALPDIVSGKLKAAPQDEKNATYCHLLTKDMSNLNFTALTPGDAEARIRAYLGFPRTRINLFGHDVIVTKAHGVMTKQSPLDLECANGAFLAIDEVVAPSGTTISGADFLRGYSARDAA